MNIFDFNKTAPESPVINLLKLLEGKTIEYAEGFKTTITEVNSNGSLNCNPTIEDEEKFSKYINEYLDNQLKFS